jgi:hypothetical protein
MPRACAVCTAIAPTHIEPGERGECGETGDGQQRRDVVAKSGRNLGDRLLVARRGDDRSFGIRAVRARRTEDAFAGAEIRDAGADGLDDAGKVDAEDQRKRSRTVRAVANLPVDRVHPRDRHPYEQFARSRNRFRQVAQRAVFAESIHRKCTHAALDLR